MIQTENSSPPEFLRKNKDPERKIKLLRDVRPSDKISSSNPRVIDDQRARQLCIDVRHSLFYETCATYGFNVDRVFSEGEWAELGGLIYGRWLSEPAE